MNLNELTGSNAVVILAVIAAILLLAFVRILRWVVIAIVLIVAIVWLANRYGFSLSDLNRPLREHHAQHRNNY